MGLPLYNGELDNHTSNVEPHMPDEHKVTCIAVILATLCGERDRGVRNIFLWPSNRVPMLVENSHPFGDLDSFDTFEKTLGAVEPEGWIHQRVLSEDHARVYLGRRFSWRDIITAKWEDNAALTMRLFLLAVRRVALMLEFSKFGDENTGFSNYECGLPEAFALRRVRTFMIALTQSPLPPIVELELAKVFIITAVGLVHQALRLPENDRRRVARVVMVQDILWTLAAISTTLKDGAELSTHYEKFCAYYSRLDKLIEILTPESVQHRIERQFDALAALHIVED